MLSKDNSELKTSQKEGALTVTVGMDENFSKEIDSRIKELQRLEKSLNELKDQVRYTILTREQYATKCFRKTGDSFIGDRKIPQFKTISDEEWERISSGKNFVVMVNGKVCSLDYFEKNILGK